MGWTILIYKSKFMKNQIGIFSIIALLTLSSYGVQAQTEKTSELGIGYGIITSNAIGNLLGDFVVGATTGAKSENHQYAGASFINYNYAIKDNFTVGGELAYERITKDIKRGGVKDGKQTDNAFTIAATSKYSYIAKPKFRMYSGIGLGYTTIQGKFEPVKGSSSKATKGNDGQFGYHVTGLGFRFGNKVAFNAELGFGYKGIFNFGLNYQL